jgi:hypothetical protein
MVSDLPVFIKVAIGSAKKIVARKKANAIPTIEKKELL